MTNRAFMVTIGAVAALVAVACGSNGGGGGGSGAGGTSLPASDCNNQCGQIMESCGYDPSTCGSFCAQGVSNSALACAQGAYCDPDQISSCFQPSTSSSSSSGSTSTGTSTYTDTGTTDTGPACIPSGQSGCDPLGGPYCCATGGGSGVICNNGVCCAGSYQACKNSTECCDGTTCIMDDQAGEMLCE